MLFKYGSGNGIDPLEHPLVERASRGRRHGSGPVSFMKGYDSVSPASSSRVGKTPARGEDGHPQRPTTPTSSTSLSRRSWRRRRPGALIDAGLRRRLQRPRRRVRLGAVPERQPLRPRHRTTSCAPWRRTRVEDPRRDRPEQGHGHLQGPRADAQDGGVRPGCAASPGMQFDTTVNDWHPCPNTARINASESLLRVHVPRRLGVQPGLAQPDALLLRRQRLRRGGLPPRPCAS
jgi:ribonucleoside-diphosphate reductase alpha chain